MTRLGVKWRGMVCTGWTDGYTNPVFRMLRRLPRVTAIVGPWSHEWPDCAKPGPQIGYLQVSRGP